MIRSIDRHAELRKKTIPEQPGFSAKHRLLMQSRLDGGKVFRPQGHIRSDRPARATGWGNRGASLREGRRAAGNPFQGRLATGIEAHPLRRLAVHGDPHAHRVVPRGQGNDLGTGLREFTRRQHANLLLHEIDLHDALAEEIRPEQSIDALPASPAYRAQIERQSRLGNGKDA